MSKNIEKRGSGNSSQQAYTDTVATYAPVSGAVDNIIQSIACDSSVFVGAVVRMSGSNVVNALADSRTNSNVIGICVAKSSSTVCDVQVTGFTDSIFTGLTVNSPYFLSASTAGEITTTPPTGTGEIAIPIGTPQTTTKMIVKIGTGLKRA